MSTPRQPQLSRAGQLRRRLPVAGRRPFVACRPEDRPSAYWVERGACGSTHEHATTRAAPREARFCTARQTVSFTITVGRRGEETTGHAGRRGAPSGQAG
eukprot:3542658-Prymnesium_polylepis.1